MKLFLFSGHLIDRRDIVVVARYTRGLFGGCVLWLRCRVLADVRWGEVSRARACVVDSREWTGAVEGDCWLRTK
jgi:hypothetical protein